MTVASRVSSHTLEVWGDFACFSRPEMKVERFTYPCPTPSAARAVFEAIYFKPEFRWQVTRIELLSWPALIALRRNEVKDKLNPAAVGRWMSGKAAVEPIWADGDASLLGTDMKGRTQRQTMALRNPRFRLTARVLPRPGKESQQRAFDEQFVRRASQGKCFQQPYLGCREFVAFFAYVKSAGGTPPVDFSQKLGLMLYDVFDLRKTNTPLGADGSTTRPFITLFDAEIRHGVLEIPDFDDERVLKPEPGERRAG
ncbi:MAG: type I-C CRISPR-associated protein Cas5 [Thermoguttaceae bacterium]|nr:type I-C CRISPR-associated protein Cas5 [Thermoguttaceae bacterium]